MRKSENYGLNLVEGTDIVNPLVQDVPNYEVIDAEMKKNADAGVPVATELLSGTVHALTRENPDAPLFRFVATSNYKSGDTFTVDGVQVTALLTSGEPLATGSYVINSNVICCLSGTVLTLFCSNSLADVHAVDSDKLGGNDAGYYATANSVVEAINLAQNANTISLANQSDIEELRDSIGGAGGCELLASTSNTNGQNKVTVNNLNQYKFLMLSISSTSQDILLNPATFPVELFKLGGAFQCSHTGTSSGTASLYYAKTSYVSDTEVVLSCNDTGRKAYLYGIK